MVTVKKDSLLPRSVKQTCRERRAAIADCGSSPTHTLTRGIRTKAETETEHEGQATCGATSFKDIIA